uniref:RRM domain-containing protein n=1 Tax=Aegilops tauschii subsp. strangulata TaxID=200361 RepID=A0A453PHA2_AEGTS
MKQQDGASPAKMFIGGLSRQTSMGSTFKEYFGKYGEIIDAVIMKDRHTQKPRGFGFITYSDPAIVDRVIEDNHVIDGKQVEIKRTIPKGAAPLKDFKTKKIFVGGLPTALTDGEFKDFFSKFGKVVEHEIICDHSTNRSRGFGFIVFDAEKTVDELLAKKGNKIDLNGTQVEIKKAEPKKPSNPPHSLDSKPRRSPYADGYDGFASRYNNGGRFAPYKSPGFGARPGSYSSAYVPGSYSSAYVPGDYSSSYGGYDGAFGGYHGESSLYTSRFGGSYGGGLGGAYGRDAVPYGGGLGGAYGRDAVPYGTSSYGPSYDSSGASADPSVRSGVGGLYGARGGYGSSSGGGATGRYHPYAG